MMKTIKNNITALTNVLFPVSWSIKKQLKNRFWTSGKICIAILCILFSSCEEFIDIDPPITEIANEDVFSADESAERAIMGIYREMTDINGPAGGGRSSVAYLSSFSADELNYLSTDLGTIEFSTNALLSNNGRVFTIWGKFYKYIFYTNAALKGLGNTSNVNEGIKNQLEGEAKFIRGFCYFYLVNLYGDVPLILSTDPQENRLAYRTSKDEVYEQIISDLEDAKQLLSDNYGFSDGERVRVNKFAAHALLARIYLFLEDWEKAEAEASLVINNTTTYSLLTDLNGVFLTNSNEAIWQFSNPTDNPIEGWVFIPNVLSSSTQIVQELSSQLINAFEDGDQRKLNWIDSVEVDGNTFYYPFKYKIRESGEPVTEYTTLLRLAEQYLIRAEARAQQGDVTGAQADLNVIRNRAGLENTTANDQASLLAAIEQERFVELFTEWGHRWLDLKRTGRADAVLGTLKTDWQPADALYPIPQSEVDVNANLTQNPGY